MPGEFEEDKHPRAEDGKFSSGGATTAGTKEHTDPAEAMKDTAFVMEHQSRLTEAYNYAGIHHGLQAGSDAAHEVGTKAAHEEAGRILGENAARKAGLVPAVPEQYRRAKAAVDEGNKAVGDIVSDMEPEHQAAIKAAYELGELRNEDHGIGDDLIGPEDFHGTLDSGLEGLGREPKEAPEVQGHGEALKRLESLEVDTDEDGQLVEFDDTDRPDRVQYDDGEAGDQEYNRDLAEHNKQQSEYQKAAEEYKRIHASMQERFDAKAAEAQDALEALHAKQIAALGKLKDTQKKIDEAKDLGDSASDDDSDPVLERVKAKFRGKAEFDEETGEWSDSKVDDLYRHAQRAYENDLDDAQSQIDDDEFRGSDDAQYQLKEAAKETAATIKHLSKYTGRPAKIAGAKPKAGKTKKSAGPGVMVDGSELVCVAFLDI